MQASSIWVGHDYAYFPARGRGENFRRHNVMKVTPLKVYKQRDWASERARTMVEVRVLKDGENNATYVGDILEVRARDIASFWDEYEAQRNEVQERIDRAEAERERLTQETKAREIRIEKALLARGYEGSISFFATTVSLNLTQLEEYLNIKPSTGRESEANFVSTT